MNKNLNKYLLKESVDNLTKQIAYDYGDIYDFTKQDLDDYIQELNCNYVDINIDNHIKMNYKITPDNTTVNKRVVNEKKRCHARTWGNGYLNIANYMEYYQHLHFPDKTCNKNTKCKKSHNKSDGKSQDKNKNNLELKPQSFGVRCQRERYESNKYCKQHCKNLKHGDYRKLPSKMIQGSYIEKHLSQINPLIRKLTHSMSNFDSDDSSLEEDELDELDEFDDDETSDDETSDDETLDDDFTT